MTRLHAALVAAAVLPLATAGAASAVPLDDFAIIAATTVTNTGTSTITGDIGLWQGSAVTGFPVPGVDIGTIYAGSSNAIAEEAQSDLTIRYNAESSNPVTQSLTGQNLGGSRTLDAGVYGYDISAGLTGDLTLDGQGNPNSVFIFKIGSTLTTAMGSRILLTNGASGANVYFLVGSSATLGASSTFNGKIIADASISFDDAVTIECGAAWARNGAVTLIGDIIDTTCPVSTADVGDVVDTTATDNAAAVAAALDSSGPLPTPFENLIDFLSPTQLADVLDQLSGEAGSGAAAAGGQSMDSFLSTVTNNAEQSGGPTSAGPEENGPGPATVKTLGYDSEPKPAPAEVAAISLARPMTDTGRWNVWMQGYGSQSNTSGDATAGTRDLSTGALGLAAGFGRQVTPDTNVGIALGAGGSSFTLADGLGGGNSSTIQAAAYGRTNFGAAYVTTAVAYAYDAVTTARNVVIPMPLNINDRYTASYSANDVSGRVETGYRFGSVTPYAAVRVGAFFTPAYSESGTGADGLDYQARTALSVRSELGARIAHTFALRDGATWALRAGAAWAHDYMGTPDVTTGFQGIPDSTFAVSSAKASPDWLLVSAGTEYGFGNGFAVAANFDGAFASNAQVLAGTARVSYRW